MLNSPLPWVLIAVGLALAPRLPRLRQRYDNGALSPIRLAPSDAEDPALSVRLAAWVTDGAGSGASLLPWHHARVPRPLATLRLSGTHAAAVRHFGHRLAGYHQLDERSRLGGILYRIGVQLRPLLWCLPRRGDEPWDDAWLDQADDARVAALSRWKPRRPTLIVLNRLPPTRVEEVIRALDHAASAGGQPVRVLVLEAPPAA